VIGRPATSVDETPVFFDAEDGTLFGFFGRPTVDPLGVGIVLLPGGSTPLSTNRNRFSVRVCREMAASGYHSMRFDYHGAGESTGMIERLDLAQPFVHDLRAAVAWMQERGVREFVFVGSCFGGRTGLSAAPAIPGTKAVVMISPPVRDESMGERGTITAALEWSLGRYLRRALHPRTIAGLFDANHRKIYARYVRMKRHALSARRRNGSSPTDAAPSPVQAAGRNLLEPLAALVDRRVPVLFLFGETEVHHMEFQRAREGALGEILDRAGDLIEVVTIPGRVHGLPSLRVQDAAAELVSEWLSRRTDAAPIGAASVST
jgi:pimeloyl-ACP methyl ester carboxylesterase